MRVVPNPRAHRVIVIAALSSALAPEVYGQTPTPTPSPAVVAQVMEAAIAERDSLPAATGSLWRFEGPFNQDNGGKGIVSGRINEIAIHPTNRMIMYATAPTGGVWKTTDGGTTWASRSNGWPIQSATAVAIDPNNGNRIFVGTGDYKRLDHIEPFSVGIMRSLNGGLTWSNFGAAQMHEQTVSRIVVDPNDQTNILATTGRGSRRPSGQIFRSTNTGANWGPVVDNLGNPMPDGNWDDLEVSKAPMNAGLIFWASATRRKNYDGGDAGGANGLLYQSRDSGATWTKVSVVANGFNLDTAARPDTIQIAARPSSTTVFVAVFQGANARVFFSSDGGNTWNERVSALAFSTASNPWAHNGFCSTPNNLYIAGTPLFIGRFTEGVGFAFFPTGGPIHEDIQCVVEDPLDPNAVFVGTDGGIYHYSATTDKCTSLSGSLGVTQVYRMDVHDRDGGLIGIGSQDLGNSVSFADNGNTPADLLKPPAWAVVQNGDGRSAAFRDDNTARVYLSNTDGRVRKYDGTTAVNLQGTCAPTSQVPLLFNNDTLFEADTQFWQLAGPESKLCTAADFCSAGLCKIQDPDPPNACNVAPCPGTGATADWMPSAFKIPAPAGMQALAMCPSNKQTVYAGSITGGMFYSTDAGATSPWQILSRTGLGPTGVPIWAISPSSSNCTDVLVGLGYDSHTVVDGSNTLLTGNRVFQNTNAPAAGSTWTAVHGNGLPHAPTYAIVRHPAAPDTRWYVANDVGVFRTDDAGVNWTNATAPLGLPNTLVRDLRISADGKILYAGTFGRGVWSSTVDPPADHFGVRGILTQGGAPISGAAAVASGAGRVEKWLKNLLTTGPVATTAPIDIPESAAIANASAVVRVRNAESVSLVAPDGTTRSMTLGSTLFGVSQFTLSGTAATAFNGKFTRGKWTFNLTGTPALKAGRLSPSIVSAMVSFGFTDRVSVLTGPDGEYTMEYLARGSHVIGIFDCDCQSRTIDFQSNQTGVNFQSATVGEFAVQPVLGTARVGDELFYKLAYTITDGRSWRDLANVQLRFGDSQGTILWILFDAAKRTFSLVNPNNGSSGPDFAAGRPNRLESSAATLYLADTQFTPNVPNTSSVTLTLALSFKPSAAGRVYQVEVLSKDLLGHTQGPELAGTVQVSK